MKPYYDEGGIVIYHGDCLEVLPTLGGFVAVVTDAPYGIGDRPMLDLPGRGGRGNNTYHPPSAWDAAIDPAWCAVACEAAPIVAWFGSWRKRAEVEAAMRWPIRCEIVWSKDTHTGPPAPVAMRDERIWIFGRAGITPTRFDTSVWDEPVIPTWSYKHHKNEKPERLMRRLVSWLTTTGPIVDPFMGSGSTLRAAKDLRVPAVGIEVDERYCDMAARRLRQEVLPLEADVRAEVQGSILELETMRRGERW
jgi:hypothetical protein